jgi:hypothetical protein
MRWGFRFPHILTETWHFWWYLRNQSHNLTDRHNSRHVQKRGVHMTLYLLNHSSTTLTHVTAAYFYACCGWRPPKVVKRPCFHASKPHTLAIWGWGMLEHRLHQIFGRWYDRIQHMFRHCPPEPGTHPRISRPRLLVDTDSTRYDGVEPKAYWTLPSTRSGRCGNRVGGSRWSYLAAVIIRANCFETMGS